MLLSAQKYGKWFWFQSLLNSLSDLDTCVVWRWMDGSKKKSFSWPCFRKEKTSQTSADCSLHPNTLLFFVKPYTYVCSGTHWSFSQKDQVHTRVSKISPIWGRKQKKLFHRPSYSCSNVWNVPCCHGWKGEDGWSRCHNLLPIVGMVVKWNQTRKMGTRRPQMKLVGGSENVLFGWLHWIRLQQATACLWSPGSKPSWNNVPSPSFLKTVTRHATDQGSLGLNPKEEKKHVPIWYPRFKWHSRVLFTNFWDLFHETWSAWMDLSAMVGWS